MNVSFLSRRADVVPSFRDAMTVMPSLHLADVVTEFIAGPPTAASYLTTEAGGRLLTEAGDLLTTEY